MKNLLLFALLLTASTFTIAQNQVVKLGITNLGTAALNPEYEYILNDNSSIQAELFVKIPRKVGGRLTGLFEGNKTDNNIIISSSSANYFGFSLAYRYYTGGAAPKGFFVSPFLKYGSFRYAMEATFDDIGGSNFDVPASGNATFNMTSLGADLGYQWIINDKMTVNWSFIGVGFGIVRAKGVFQTELTSEFDEWKMDVEDFLESIPLGLEKRLPIQIDVPNEQMSTSGTVPLPVFRSSLSIGYIIN